MIGMESMTKLAHSQIKQIRLFSLELLSGLKLKTGTHTFIKLRNYSVHPNTLQTYNII